MFPVEESERDPARMKPQDVERQMQQQGSEARLS